MLHTTFRWLAAAVAVVAAATVAVIVATTPAAAQTSGFGDVPTDAYYATPVAELHAEGVFNGTLCDDGFCPWEPIDRKTMAVWIVRVLDGQDPPAITQSRFDDVDPASFHARFIERMAELGVTRGCGDLSGFCPDRNVSRAQMAVFLSRAYNLPPGPDPGYEDVPDDAWYADDVARLAASGITVGCDDGVFCPSRDTTRGQMATFLHRAIDGSSSLDVEEDVVQDRGRARALEAEGSEGDGIHGPRTIVVHSCGPPGSAYATDAAKLRERIREIREYVGGFFREQSGYTPGSSTGVDFSFVEGETLSPSVDRHNRTLAWASQNIAQWADDESGDDPCTHEATAHTPDQPFLTLVDIPTGPCQVCDAKYVAGFAAGIRRYPLVVATPENRRDRVQAAMGDFYDRSDQFLRTVAHEIGHAIGFHHPWKIAPKVDLATYTNPDMEQRDKQVANALGHDRARSLMSYLRYGSRADLDREARIGRSAYLACAHLYQARWVELVDGNCERPLFPPHPPDNPPEVIPGDRSLSIRWKEPTNDGGALITDYRVRYKPEHIDEWTDWQPNVESDSLETTIVELTNGVLYEVQVASVNRVGRGEHSSSGTGTPGGTILEVILSLGDSAEGQPTDSGPCGVHCRWLDVELRGFPPGEQTLACAHNGVEEVGAARGVYESAVVSDWPATESCLFGYPGREVFVIVGAERRGDTWYGGTYSNTLVWPSASTTTVINDYPVLRDSKGEYSWWKPPADIDRLGYGDNGFHFTLAIGNDDDSSLDNWAIWEFGDVDGSYEVQAWIPADWATAHVQYLIWADENGDGQFTSNEYVSGPWLDQQQVREWQSLGTYDLRGRVRIEVRDVRARDDHRDDGPVNTRLAVDAIRLLPTDRVGSSGTHPGTPTDVAFRNGRAVWEAMAGAESYDVQECTSGEVSDCLIHQDIYCCRFALDALSTSFRVRAVNSAGESQWSSRVRIARPSECSSEVNDEPRLVDDVGPYSWWEPPPQIASLGYNGDFHFTLAIGNSNDDARDNWAIWEFGSVDGHCEVQAWIPADWATAHVQYLIWADENGDGRFASNEYVAGPWLDQQQVSGWQSLGTYDLRGRVRIEVRDVRTRDDHRDDGPVNTRLAVDAIRLKPR